MRAGAKVRIGTGGAPRTGGLVGPSRLLRAGATALSGLVVLAGTVLVLAVSPSAASAQDAHECAFCHNLQGGTYSQLGDFETSEDLCLSCHSDAGPARVDRSGSLVAAPRRQSIHDGAKHATATRCRNCHGHADEAGANLALIPLQLATPGSGIRDVVFTDYTGPNSFADGDETLDGVCEVCHTATSYHRNYAGEAYWRSHGATEDCTACHAHEAGFQPQGGSASCTTCHAAGQGTRRAVVGEFDRSSHHVDWVAAGYADPSSIPDTDCLVCHDQSQHQQGSVRLRDPDDPDNTGAAIVLNGDPNTSSAEAAKLVAFCLGCHDGDGSAGDTAPFSGGATVPSIDPAAWTGSSHAASGAIAGCYGNGTYGCHATGHGSEKASLLAPADVAPDPTTAYEEEEGFCFACHDADGPAGSDIAAKYAGPIQWVTGPVGDQDNVNLNDRHDVQQEAQARSGAVIECVACHDPHAANAFQMVIPDPDPTDGRVPGSGYVPGATTMTEWCLDCHDGSFAAGVTAPTTPLFDLLPSYTDAQSGDAMGAAGSNTDLKGGYGYTADMTVQCAACHDPHASANLFHVDTVYSADETTVVPSDGTPAHLTDNAVQDVTVNGYNWCNTCHTGSMGSNRDNCFACHYHGSRW